MCLGEQKNNPLCNCGGWWQTRPVKGVGVGWVLSGWGFYLLFSLRLLKGYYSREGRDLNTRRRNTVINEPIYIISARTKRCKNYASYDDVSHISSNRKIHCFAFRLREHQNFGLINWCEYDWNKPNKDRTNQSYSSIYFRVRYLDSDRLLYFVQFGMYSYFICRKARWLVRSMNDIKPERIRSFHYFTTGDLKRTTYQFFLSIKNNRYSTILYLT